MPDPRPAWGWRAYFCVAVVFFVLVNAVVALAGPNVLDLVDVPISAIGLTGLYGYAFGRRLLSPHVWPIWWKLQPLWDSMLAFLLVPLVRREDIGIGDVALNVVFLATRVPLYVALFRYARPARTA